MIVGVSKKRRQCSYRVVCSTYKRHPYVNDSLMTPSCDPWESVKCARVHIAQSSVRYYVYIIVTNIIWVLISNTDSRDWQVCRRLISSVDSDLFSSREQYISNVPGGITKKRRRFQRNASRAWTRGALVYLYVHGWACARIRACVYVCARACARACVNVCDCACLRSEIIIDHTINPQLD